MLAKIGSDFKKPYGLTIISEKEVSEFLSPLEVRKIPGVGPRTEEILHDWDEGCISALRASTRARLWWTVRRNPLAARLHLRGT